MKCLGIVGNELRGMSINAEYDEWTGKIVDYYWTYTYIESENSFETGCKSGIIIIDGFTKKNISELERQKELIINKFQDYRTTVNDTVVYLGSANAEPVNTYDKELKRIQINIDFKEWRN